jgi:hypothetical protein
MRTILLLSAVLMAAGTLQSADPAPTEEAKKSEPAEKVVFKLINNAAWKSNTDDVKKLLYTTADELVCFYPDRKFPVIEVGPNGGPITYFDRGAKGEIRVRLDVEGSYWNQLVYQFAHEMGHIVCDYKSHEHKNKWFEESVCETASIYVLRKVADKWKTSPAIKGAESYAKNYLSYAQRRIDSGKLPEGKTFADWLKENMETLAIKNGDARAQQTIIASNAMLKHFERDPKNMWAAMAYLNTEKLTKIHTFEAYLTAWHRNCPDALKSNVKQLAAEFQVEIKE